jgi:hypothetical protein
MTNYEDYRSKIKSGDVIAFSNSDWDLKTIASQIIRIATRSEYNHVGLVFKISGRLMLVEAVVPYVRMVPLSDYVEKGFYVLHMKTPPSKAETEFAMSLVGKQKYSVWQAVKAFFKQLKIGDDEFWQCAELVITARRLSGVNLGDVATPSRIVKESLLQGYEISYVKGQ